MSDQGEFKESTEGQASSQELLVDHQPRPMNASLVRGQMIDVDVAADENGATLNIEAALSPGEDVFTPRSSLRRQESAPGTVRYDHLQKQRMISQLRLQWVDSDEAQEVLADAEEKDAELFQKIQKEMDSGKDKVGAALQSVQKIYKQYGADKTFQIQTMKYPLEVRMKGFTVTVPQADGDAQIKTVYNSSPLFPIVEFLKKIRRGKWRVQHKEIQKKAILADINLVLQPGKSYLVLGPPSSGKSTLLRAITGRIRPGKGSSIQGEISYNGRTLLVST